MQIWQSERLLLCGFHHLAATGLVRQAIASRVGGSSDPPFSGLNLGLRSGDDPDRVRDHRQRFCRALGINPTHVVAGRQVHGAGLALVGVGERGQGALEADSAIPDTDALATAEPGVALFLLMADCTPILVLDPVRRAIAIVHAGWRGTAQRIAARAVGQLAEAYGSRPSDLLVGIGPVIGRCCYEVDQPVIDGIRAAQPEDAVALLTFKANGRAQLDLAEANRRQLVGAGVPPQQIELSGICTACTTALFYSERREGRPSGRFGALLMIEPGRGGA